MLLAKVVHHHKKVVVTMIGMNEKIDIGIARRILSAYVGSVQEAPLTVLYHVR